ncbi:hypothetical protein H1R20_g14649, partial [Candolleomyces eurysporus]
MPTDTNTTKLTTVYAIIVASETSKQAYLTPTTVQKGTDLSPLSQSQPTVIMMISIFIGFYRYKASNNRLLSVFHRDGIFYFVTLAGVTTANIIFDSAAPLEYRFMLAAPLPSLSLSSQLSHSPQGCLHSILSCRLILHLHEFAEKELSTPESQQNKSSLQFAVTAATELTAGINSNRVPHESEIKEEC